MVIIFAVVMIFAGYALYLGKESIVIKIVEIIGIFSAGFAGGYGLKTAKQPRNNPNNQ